MAFFLHTSNRTENLIDHLAAVLKTPLSSPFEKDVFLIQSQGMERWLLQQLSDKFGVFANFDLLFPNAFFNQVAKRLDARGSLKPELFARERLVWTVETVLREQQDNDAFPEIKSYLSDGMVDAKRFQLAQQLTQLFDQYQLFRPDLVEDKSQEHWTLRLWQEVLNKMPSKIHIGRAWSQMIEQMDSAAENHYFSQMPPRISVFGIHTMPELFLQALRAMARHTDVHLYVTQPSEGYWGELRSRSEVKKANIRRVFSDELQNSEDELNHPLLSLLGQQGRDFHQMLIDKCQFSWEFDSFEGATGSALQQLQEAIRLNQEGEKVLVTDESIQCVSCHSRLREMQVLKDFLLKTLQQNPEIELRDIVVMAPNIADYEPFIKTVLNDVDLPFAIADRSARNANQTFETFMAFLQLLNSRFEWSEVMDLIEREPMRQLLDLDDYDVSQIETWVAATHTRWGRSAEHKAELQLPELHQNTWDAGLQQMMLGFVMQGQSVEIEGSQAQVMAKLDGFVRNILFKCAKESRKKLTPKEWADWLLMILAELFDAQLPEVTGLVDSVMKLQQIEVSETYALNAVMAWLEEAISEHKSSQGFMAGQLTFCSMLPMRSIPFKVVAVLGLSEGQFPRQDRRSSFDLMAENPRIGDRSARADDRYQFLETILAAREVLYLSYVGQSQKKPQDIPPSVVLQELLDELELKTIKHPLQAFSPEYFKQDSTLQTFDHTAQNTALALQTKSAEFPAWIGELHLPAFEQSVVNFRALLQFARDPQRWFVEQRLGIRQSGIESEMEVHESFELGHLEKYQLDQTILDSLQMGAAPHAVQQNLIASGAWPCGSVGESQLQQRISKIEGMKQAISQLDLGTAKQSTWFNVPLGDVHLEGAMNNEYENAYVFARFATLKPKDWIQAWLTHLLSGKTVYLAGLEGEEKIKIYQFRNAENRYGHLQNWVMAYCSAYSSPSAFWPTLSWAWQLAWDDPKKQKLSDDARSVEADKAAKDAWRKLLGEAGYKSNYVDPYVARLSQGLSFEEIWTEAEFNLGDALLKPLFAHSEEVVA